MQYRFAVTFGTLSNWLTLYGSLEYNCTTTKVEHPFDLQSISKVTANIYYILHIKQPSQYKCMHLQYVLIINAYICLTLS